MRWLVALALVATAVAGCGEDDTASYHATITISASPAPSNTTFVKHGGRTHQWVASPSGFAVTLRFAAKDQAAWQARAAASMNDPMDQILIVRDGTVVARLFLTDSDCEPTTVDGRILGNETNVVLVNDALLPSCWACKYELADHSTCI